MRTSGSPTSPSSRRPRGGGRLTSGRPPTVAAPRRSIRRSTPALHPDLAELAFLLGTWRGEGRGDLATADEVAFGEELTFDHVGERYLVYSQQTWLLDDGSPLHLERGFLRPGRDGGWELTVAHPLGLSEVAHGRLQGMSLRFDTGEGDVRRTETGVHVLAFSRRYAVDGDLLRTSLGTTTDATPRIRHAEAELRRVDATG